MFAANMTLEVSQAAFLFEVGSAAPRGLLRLCRVLLQLEHEMTRGAEGRQRMQPCSKAPARGFSSAASPLGPQRATAPARHRGARSCCWHLLPPGVQGRPRAWGVPGCSRRVLSGRSVPRPSPPCCGWVGGRMGGVRRVLPGLGLARPAARGERLRHGKRPRWPLAQSLGTAPGANRLCRKG